MAFREKLSWISVATCAAIYGAYFSSIARTALAGHTPAFGFGGPLAASIVALTIAQIVLIVVVAVAAPKEANSAPDERERLIDLRATSVGFYVMVTGTILACVAIGLGQPPFYTANGLFLTIVVAEIVRSASRIYFYRRGV